MQDELESDEDDGEKLGNAKELAGMRVRHDADELGEGETMILTLADRNILDEHGEVDEDKDELENALMVRPQQQPHPKTPSMPKIPAVLTPLTQSIGVRRLSRRSATRPSRPPGDVCQSSDTVDWRPQIEQKKRDKAKRAASKEERIKPLFGKDGKQRTMLDKYDEEEDTGMDIDEAGAFSSEKAKQQAEIRAKLAAG